MSEGRSLNTDGENRRDFLHKFAIGSVAGAGILAFAGIIQLPLPKVFNEPSSKFKIGYPSDWSSPVKTDTSCYVFSIS